MTSVLGRGAGIFSLHDSDIQVGSYFTEKDLLEILHVQPVSLTSVASVEVDGNRVFNESDVRKAWYAGGISGAPPHRIRNFQMSLDELLVAKLIELSYPSASIDHQVPWVHKANGRRYRRSLDLVIRHPDLGSKVIEFHGPQHFAPGRYGVPKENPLLRKEQIEAEFGMECIIWPYWIQLCMSNVRALFEPDIQGYGLLWSTNTHFGDFVFDDSAKLILSLSRRFNAVRQESVGYFYGPNTEGRNNPAHPIIAKILSGRLSPGKLLPRGYDDPVRWLPRLLTQPNLR